MSLYQEIIFLDNYFNGLYLIENVIPYYTPLINPNVKLHRHLYWCNFPINNFIVTNDRKHDDIRSGSTIYGFNISKYKLIEDKTKILRNMVDPELGLHILNCALGIRTKKNTKQTELEF